MGAWAFQGVLNVGVQIVLIVFSGWCFARFGLLTAEQFMGQINVLLLRVAFPMLNIYLLGIKVDLRDAEAWRSLGAYMLWVSLVQMGILTYVWLCSGRTIGDAGLLNLVLTANNTVIVGLPVMEATFPVIGGRLSLLTAFVLFLQVIPFSITAFEVEKWMVEDHRRRIAAAETVSEPPSTPVRELSGRWVAEEPSGSSGCSGNVTDNCNGGGGCFVSGSNGVAAEPPMPRTSDDNNDTDNHKHGDTIPVSNRARRRHSLCRSSGSSIAAAVTSVGGGGRLLVPIRGRLGRRRVGSGVVVGAVARGWAPATPVDSPEPSTRPTPLPTCVQESADRPKPSPDSQEATPHPSVAASKGGHGSPCSITAGNVSETPNVDGSREVREDRALALELALDLFADSGWNAAEERREVVAASTAAEASRGAGGPSRCPQVTQAPTPGSAALACLDHAASAPCPSGANGAESEHGLAGTTDVVVGGDGDGAGQDPEFATNAAIHSPSAAHSRCTLASSASICSSTAAVRLPSAFAFRPHPADAVVTAAAVTPANVSSAPVEAPPSVTYPPASTSNALPNAATAPTLIFPSLTLATPSMTTAIAIRNSSHDSERVGPNGRPRRRRERLAFSRASTDHYGPSTKASTIGGPMGQLLSGGGGNGGAAVDTAGGIQRRSLPAHWPPGPAGNDSSHRTAAAAIGCELYGSSAAQAPSPSLSPPRSHRLSRPVAMACPDLPVPQAISMALPKTSVPTEALARQNGCRPSRTAYDNTARAVSGGNEHVITRVSAGRQLTTAPPAVPVSVSGLASAPAAVNSIASQYETLDPPLLPPDRALARAAAGIMTRRHGGLVLALGRWFKLRLKQHSRAWSITWVIAKNPLLWSLLVALVINLSGLRSILWPASPHYRPELGWVAGALSWTSGITVPVSLFSNGVWLYGKTFARATLLQAGWLLVLKLIFLGPLQLACAAVCGLEAAAAMSLLLLALCPVASTSFVIASQYGHGADVVTAMTMLGIVLLVPAVLVALALPRAFGLYQYHVSPASS